MCRHQCRYIQTKLILDIQICCIRILNRIMQQTRHHQFPISVHVHQDIHDFQRMPDIRSISAFSNTSGVFLCCEMNGFFQQRIPFLRVIFHFITVHDRLHHRFRKRKAILTPRVQHKAGCVFCRKHDIKELVDIIRKDPAFFPFIHLIHIRKRYKIGTSVIGLQLMEAKSRIFAVLFFLRCPYRDKKVSVIRHSFIYLSKHRTVGFPFRLCFKRLDLFNDQVIIIQKFILHKPLSFLQIYQPHLLIPS